MIKLSQLFQYLRVWPEILLVLFAFTPCAPFHLGEVRRRNPGLFGGLPEGQLPAFAQTPEVFTQSLQIRTVGSRHGREYKPRVCYCKHYIKIIVYRLRFCVYVLANDKNVKVYNEQPSTGIS